MTANGQHEDLIKFVSEAWNRLVVNSLGGNPHIYFCSKTSDQPQHQQTMPTHHSRNYSGSGPGGASPSSGHTTSANTATSSEPPGRSPISNSTQG